MHACRCSLVVSGLLSRLVWLYNTAFHDGDEPEVRLCKVRISHRIARSLLLFFILLNYCAVYFAWYSLFKETSHNWRDAIFQVFNEAMVDRFCTILELLPRTAHTIRSWAPLWNHSMHANASAAALLGLGGGGALADGSAWPLPDATSPDGHSSLAAAPFSLFALELMRSAAPFGDFASELGNAYLGVQALGPPTSRSVIDAPILSLLYVPPSEAAPVRGVRLHLVNGAAIYQMLDETNCVVGACSADVRAKPWWAEVVAGGGSSRWSEVHLMGEQLAVSFVLPMEANGDGGWIAATLPLVALQPAFRMGTGSVELGGLVMEADSSAAGTQKGALVSSSANDAELRFEVGGLWHTARRRAEHSVHPTVRAAAAAVRRTFLGFHYRLPSPSLIGPAHGIQLSPTTRLVDPEAGRIYRTYGAPRTFITPLRGTGCVAAANGSLEVPEEGAADDYCGLDWTAVMLIDWIDFFSDWYRDRDFSFVIFLCFLLLQLHVVHVLVHSSFHHIEHYAAQADNLDETNRRPNYQEALLDVAEPQSSARTSHSTARHSVAGNARFERYRVHISNEVHEAIDQEFERFKWLQFLQRGFYTILENLPCGLQELKQVKRLKLQLWQRRDSTVKFSPRERNHRHAIQFLRLSKQHRNLLTVCSLRRDRRYVALQTYLLQSMWSYRTFIQLVAFLHCLLQVRGLDGCVPDCHHCTRRRR